MNNQLTRSAALMVAATLLAAGAATTLAGTAVAATSPHLIDTDWVKIGTSAGQVYGTSGESLRSGSVQASLPGTVQIYPSATGCVLARVIYTYANGSTEAQVSPPACKGGLTGRDASFSSLISKDLVKYAVQLLKATDESAPATVIAGSTYFVGDAPDSLGTKERLDHDTLTAVRNTDTVFRGWSDYSITKYDVFVMLIWSVRSRVVGDLTWSDKLVGSYAVASITWTYADGSTSSVRSSRLHRDRAPIHVDKMSDKLKDVVSVEVTVYTDSRSTFGGAASPVSKFGDHTFS